MPKKPCLNVKSNDEVNPCPNNLIPNVIPSRQWKNNSRSIPPPPNLHANDKQKQSNYSDN